MAANYENKPYKGHLSYQVEDAGLFFGRVQEADQSIEARPRVESSCGLGFRGVEQTAEMFPILLDLESSAKQSKGKRAKCVGGVPRSVPRRVRCNGLQKLPTPRVTRVEVIEGVEQLL